MSLTGHLRRKQSPVRAWIEERFPATQTFSRDANRELCQGDGCLLPAPEGSDLGLVGTGVDYLIRACLRVRALDDTVARRTAEKLDQLQVASGKAGRAERKAVKRIKALRPTRVVLDDEGSRELASLCLFLARIEQYYRAGPNPALFQFLIFPLEDWDGDELDELVATTVPEPSIEDLSALGRSVVSDQLTLTKRRPLRLNPKFALSVDLGGADADLIAGSTLVDWKATTTSRAVGRQELWQLLGYALADTKDEYRIDHLAVGALRWRMNLSWPLDQFMAGLAPADLPPLAKLRREFAKLVREVRAEQRARFEAARTRRQREQERT